MLFSGECHSPLKRRFWREKRSVEENCQKTHFKLKKGFVGLGQRVLLFCCLLLLLGRGEIPRITNTLVVDKNKHKNKKKNACCSADIHKSLHKSHCTVVSQEPWEGSRLRRRRRVQQVHASCKAAAAAAANRRRSWQKSKQKQFFHNYYYCLVVKLFW